MNARCRFVTVLACIVALIPMAAESQQPTACSASPYRQFDFWLGDWEVKNEQDGGTLVTVTEDGEIYNPFFRVMSKLIFGYHRTQESYLSALAQKFGEAVVVERLR